MKHRNHNSFCNFFGKYYQEEIQMQKILGYLRRTIQEYDMIKDGDSIAVGVSGGKDSLVLLIGLKLLQRFIGIDYNIYAVSIDPMFFGQSSDFSDISILCEKYNIPYTVINTHIAEIVFDIRKETNPCSLCSRMRRGALNNAALELGCNKLALGHNQDDAVETFFMNLFNAGRIDCFSPVSFLSDINISVIRPLILTPEKEVSKAARKNSFPVLKSKCPEDGHTNRESMRQFIIDKEKEDRSFSDKITGALKRGNISGWGI